MTTSHEDIMASIRVMSIKVETLQARQVEIREDIKSIRRGVRTVLLSEAAQGGRWDGIQLGARLAFLAIAAAFGAGAVKTFEWLKEVFS